MRRDFDRIATKALGRPRAPRDALAARLHLLARRLGDPAATLEGLRARWRQRG